MPRNDGRLEPGQRLNGAISARAWNRMLDAADLVLGEKHGVAAERLSLVGLPCVKAIFPEKGYFGEVRLIGESSFAAQNLSPSVPASVSTAGSFSGPEAEFLNWKSVPTVACVPQAYDSPNARPDAAIAVCISNDDTLYAIAGMAFVRVRVFNYRHRYARPPQIFDGQTPQQTNDATGCLDSAFYGPAKIIGYARARDALDVQFCHSDRVPPLTWPTYEFRWALISF